MIDERELRLRDLLIDQALGETLTESELAEVRELLARYPHLSVEIYEHTASSIHLGWCRAREARLPVELLTRLERLRDRLGTRLRPLVPQPRALGTGPTVESPWHAGWWLGAAALVLALFVLPRERSIPETLTGEVVRVSWSATEDPDAAGVTGEVTWSPEADTGVMRFTGLPVNDPSEAQYQLWIFDAERSAEHPVDGGVFDAKDGTFEVPIDAKLPVDRATLFAITLEPPGGVVVSSRERLLLTAAL